MIKFKLIIILFFSIFFDVYANEQESNINLKEILNRPIYNFIYPDEMIDRIDEIHSVLDERRTEDTEYFKKEYKNDYLAASTFLRYYHDSFQLSPLIKLHAYYYHLKKFHEEGVFNTKEYRDIFHVDFIDHYKKYIFDLRDKNYDANNFVKSTFTSNFNAWLDFVGFDNQEKTELFILTYNTFIHTLSNIELKNFLFESTEYVFSNEYDSYLTTFLFTFLGSKNHLDFGISKNDFDNFYQSLDLNTDEEVIQNFLQIISKVLLLENNQKYIEAIDETIKATHFYNKNIKGKDFGFDKSNYSMDSFYDAVFKAALLRLHLANEDYENAKKYAAQVDNIFDKYIDNMLELTKEDELQTKELMITGLNTATSLFLYERFVGNKKKLIERYKKLLKIIKTLDTLDAKKFQAQFESDLSSIYYDIGDMENFNSARQRSADLFLDLKTGEYTYSMFIQQIYYGLDQGYFWFAFSANLDGMNKCMENAPQKFLDNLTVCEMIHTEFYKLLKENFNQKILQKSEELEQPWILGQSITDDMSMKDGTSRVFFWECKEEGENIDECITWNSEEKRIFSNSFDKIFMEKMELSLLLVYSKLNSYEKVTNLASYLSVSLNKNIQILPNEESIKMSFYSKWFLRDLVDFFNKFKKIDESGSELFLDSLDLLLKKILNLFNDLEDYEWVDIVLRLIKQQEFNEFIRRADNRNQLYFGEDSSLKEFKNEIEILNNDLDQIVMMKASTKDLQMVEKYDQALKDKILKLNKIKNKYFSKNITIQSIKEKNIEKLLVKNNEAIIQFIFDNNELAAWITTDNNTPKKIIITTDAAALRNKIIDYSNLLSNPKNKIDQNSTLNLSKLIINPISSEIKNKDTLKIINSDVLNLISFDNLSFEDKSLIEKFVISEYLPLPKKHFKKDKFKNNLDIYFASEGLFSNKFSFSKLPNVEKEAQRISNVSKGRFNTINIFSNDKFNQSIFIENLSKKDNSVHLATHVKSLGSKYDEIYMLMGNKKTITMKDLYESPNDFSLNTIVLSACDTSDLIPDNKQKSYFGVSSTFHYKGTKNVISSLWSIDDRATSVFMEILYDIYSSFNYDLAESLAITKRFFSLPEKFKQTENFELRQKFLLYEDKIKQYSHPYYWAPFQLSTIN